VVRPLAIFVDLLNLDPPPRPLPPSPPLAPPVFISAVAAVFELLEILPLPPSLAPQILTHVINLDMFVSTFEAARRRIQK
jgi:hypothetical protein